MNQNLLIIKQKHSMTIPFPQLWSNKLEKYFKSCAAVSLIGVAAEERRRMTSKRLTGWLWSWRTRKRCWRFHRKGKYFQKKKRFMLTVLSKRKGLLQEVIPYQMGLLDQAGKNCSFPFGFLFLFLNLFIPILHHFRVGIKGS